jgi:PAS domain S-box-containing protein
VLAARVAAGLAAARLRAQEALLRSLVANVPGALYRCACDADWTMLWLSDEIEEISGYPASDFIDSAVRPFASVIDPEDREQVAYSVLDAVDAHRPFTLEYRIRRRDGGERWVLERGQAQESGDGRRWLDGAIFDITARRAAEQALREREIVEAQLAELRDLAHGLHPAVLSDRGLEHALSSLAHRATVPVELRVVLPAERLPISVEAAAYFTVCEALTNVAKYAQASRAWVDVERSDGHLDVAVGDDGVGGADFARGSGLQGLRDRVAAVSGSLELDSRPGAGTVVRARLPIDAPCGTE